MVTRLGILNLWILAFETSVVLGLLFRKPKKTKRTDPRVEMISSGLISPNEARDMWYVINSSVLTHIPDDVTMVYDIFTDKVYARDNTHLNIFTEVTHDASSLRVSSRHF